MKLYRVFDGCTSYYFEASSPEEALDLLFEDYDWGDMDPLTPPRPGENRPASEYATVWEIFDDDEEVKMLQVHLTEVGAPSKLRLADELSRVLDRDVDVEGDDWFIVKEWPDRVRLDIGKALKVLLELPDAYGSNGDGEEEVRRALKRAGAFLD